MLFLSPRWILFHEIRVPATGRSPLPATVIASAMIQYQPWLETILSSSFQSSAAFNSRVMRRALGISENSHKAPLGE